MIERIPLPDPKPVLETDEEDTVPVLEKFHLQREANRYTWGICNMINISLERLLYLPHGPQCKCSINSS